MKIAKTSGWLFGAVVVVYLLSGVEPAISQCSAQAHTTAERFLRVVYEGAFIGGSEPAFKESLNLTMNDGDPPADPIVVTKGYSIAAESTAGNECHVTVVFDTLGRITEDLAFHPKKGKETESIWVLCTEQGCRVHMDDKRYGLPPHVGTQGVLAWLKKFQQGGQDAKAAALEKLISSL